STMVGQFIDSATFVLVAFAGRMPPRQMALVAVTGWAIMVIWEVAALPLTLPLVRAKTAEEPMGKVKAGGTFASVIRAPTSVAKNPTIRPVAFVSKQDTKNLTCTVEAVQAGKLTIPIGSRVPLRNAAEAHAAGQG